MLLFELGLGLLQNGGRLLAPKVLDTPVEFGPHSLRLKLDCQPSLGRGVACSPNLYDKEACPRRVSGEQSRNPSIISRSRPDLVKTGVGGWEELLWL